MTLSLSSLSSMAWFSLLSNSESVNLAKSSHISLPSAMCVMCQWYCEQILLSHVNVVQ